jgi:hypothetical protein
MDSNMTRWLIVFLVFPLLLGCGQSPAAKARAAADAKRRADHIADSEGEHPKTGAPILRWNLIDFTTGSIDSFRTKEELAAAAKPRGYSGDMELADVKSHYEKCFE